LKKLGALLLLVLVACGKRGDPHPPIPIIPQATTDLVVAQRGSKVLLSWGYPALTTAGKNLSNIRRVVVYRATEPLPVVQPPEPDPTTTPQPVAAFVKVPPLTPAQFVKLRTKVDSIEGANLPAASQGARLTFEDTPQIATTDGRPVRLTYAVVTEGPNATGDLSNLAPIVPLDVPVPPSALAATPKAAGVVVAWTAPAKSITAKVKPVIVGYNVYRLGEGETATEQTKPVNTSPVAATTYTDVPPYGKFTYVVTAVAGPRIESDPSAPATATFKDLTPPPAPQNVSLLIETKAVRLVWDPVQVPDLAGYKVWRREGVGHDEAIKEIMVDVPLMENLIATSYYVDSAAGIGLSYRYAVTAVDKSGNESERKWSGWVVIPKTP
jgi:hypothetical protein